ncbi:MAG: porphobilinogen synthase, partial [Planctomycetes bacterium]|nr:porphobilinogen synthase [Planctomycetota bacterium]
MAEFPQKRLRRLRRNETMRKLVRETVLNVNDLVYPLFVIYGNDTKKEIASMPGTYQFSVDKLAGEIEEIAELGIPAVILFGIPETKDETGSSGYAPDGVVQQAIKAIKKANPE